MKDLTVSGLTAECLLDILAHWDQAMPLPLHLIACGDAALTLLRLRPTMSDVDLLVPLPWHHEALLSALPGLGYHQTSQGFCSEALPQIVWHVWPGTNIFGAQLMESPLEEANHTLITAWQHISLSVLNLNDLIITQIFRGLPKAIDDCIAIFKTWEVDAEELLERYAQTSKYAKHPDVMMRRFMEFVEQLASQQLVSDEVWERLLRSGDNLRLKSLEALTTSHTKRL